MLDYIVVVAYKYMDAIIVSMLPQDTTPQLATTLVEMATKFKVLITIFLF